jgi:succinylglutamate desuccinylase
MIIRALVKTSISVKPMSRYARFLFALIGGLTLLILVLRTIALETYTAWSQNQINAADVWVELREGTGSVKLRLEFEAGIEAAAQLAV